MRKSVPELKQVIRLLGADSPSNETRESLINRILLFQPQSFKEQPKIHHEPVKPLTEEMLREKLRPYFLRGLLLEVKDGSWFVEVGDRKDSGSMCMPMGQVERTIRYLMPEGK